MWSRVKVLTPPASIAAWLLPIMKQHLEFTHDADKDALITRYIDAAVARIDGPLGAGLALMTQTWRKTLDDFPSDTIPIPLPGGPFQSVTDVNYLDTDGAAQTVAAVDTYLDLGDDPVRLAPAIDKSWPGTENQPGAVWIDYVVGHTAETDIPDDLIDAVMLYVAHRFANRSAIEAGTMMETPLGFTSIINEHSRMRAAA